jgi:excisionase family DNA binding protein
MTFSQEAFDEILHEKNMLTPAELSERLGVPRDTVYTWIKRRYFPVTRLAGRVYINPPDLAAIITTAPAHSETS